MNGGSPYVIPTDALDELGRLECVSAFIADAISCIADSRETDGELAVKCWQGLYYLTQHIADRIAEIHSQCDRFAPESVK